MSLFLSEWCSCVPTSRSFAYHSTLSYLGANGGGTDPNSDVANQGAEILLADILDTKYTIGNMSLDKDLPIGNADAGSYFNDLVLEAVDYGMANVHPWFANVSVDQSAAWTWDFFQDFDVALAQNLTNTPQMYIAETGWPSVRTLLFSPFLYRCSFVKEKDIDVFLSA